MTTHVDVLRDTEALLRDAGDEDSVRGADAIRAAIALVAAVKTLAKDGPDAMDDVDAALAAVCGVA